MANQEAGSSSQHAQQGLEAQQQQMLSFNFTCCYCDKVFTELHALDRHHYEHYQGDRSDEALKKIFDENMKKNQNEIRQALGAYLSLAPPEVPPVPDHHQVIIPTENVNENLVQSQEPAVVTIDHATPMEVDIASTNDDGTKPYVDQLDIPMEAAAAAAQDGGSDTNNLDLNLKI
ncbi:zinc finger protein [Macleaya cordata]|uniref:Zinc finger protein n=1 Tax=Macleaya cordata TaxID=56857 RepID=A0A200PW30_MACCD|nr:zinc finger protein [Macleaya cordata]